MGLQELRCTAAQLLDQRSMHNRHRVFSNRLFLQLSGSDLQVLNSMHDLDIDGANNLASAVQIAQLALKHRQNKNQRQRVVIFIGSPVAETKVGHPAQCWICLVLIGNLQGAECILSARPPHFVVLQRHY